MSVTVKAADAAQFLALVPRLLHCTPTRSLVLVPMSRGRSLGAMRLDLPPDELADDVGSRAVGMLCPIADADAFVAVVYTDAEIVGSELPGSAILGALDAHADACGLRLVDALTVAAGGWGSHADPELPPGGHSLDDLRMPGAAADALAAAGESSDPPGDQSAGAALPPVGKSARRAAALALRSLEAALEAICGIPSVAEKSARVDPAALEAACELDDLPALYEQALAWHPRDAPMRAAMLGWLLSRPSLRDVALVQWSSDQRGGDVAVEAQRRWENGERYPAELAEVMWGDGPRPDPDRLQQALAVVREVASLMPKTHRPGPLALCAWLSWALGRSSHADRYAGMALALDRKHGLAGIMRSFVQAGHLPDWAFRVR
ncbi:MAG: lipopolysaccharide biosynthesis protein [Microbacterium sp.]|nr:MAG: lipopolysaccharide biosynthesis protein [Microbacterium sp.]